MSRRSGLRILGGLVVIGAAVGVLKYLKDYGGAKYADEDKISGVKADSAKVKDAAKRTYTVIKEKGDVDSVREAVGDLSKAAGMTAVSAGDVAFSAGSSAINAAKDIKAKFDADPDASKDEMISNLKSMGQDMAKKAVDYGQEIKEKASGAVDKVKDIISQSDSAKEAQGEEDESPADENQKEEDESPADRCSDEEDKGLEEGPSVVNPEESEAATKPEVPDEEVSISESSSIEISDGD